MNFGYAKDEINYEDTPSLCLQNIELNIEKLEKKLNKEISDKTNDDHNKDKNYQYQISSDTLYGSPSSNLPEIEVIAEEIPDSLSNFKVVFSPIINNIPAMTIIKGIFFT